MLTWYQIGRIPDIEASMSRDEDDLLAMAIDYESGMSWDDLLAKYKTSTKTLQKALKIFNTKRRQVKLPIIEDEIKEKILSDLSSGKSSGDLSLFYGVSPYVIEKIRRELPPEKTPTNVQKRNPHRKPGIENDVVNLYRQLNNMLEVAKRLNIHPRVVARILSEMNEPISNPFRRLPLISDEDYAELVERYNAGEGVQQLAREYGVNQRDVRRRLIFDGLWDESRAQIPKVLTEQQLDIAEERCRNEPIKDVAKSYGIHQNRLRLLLDLRQFGPSSEIEEVMRIKRERAIASQRIIPPSEYSAILKLVTEEKVPIIEVARRYNVVDSTIKQILKHIRLHPEDFHLIYYRGAQPNTGLMAPQVHEPVTAQAKSPYGYCPICGAPGVMRERQIDGDDKCRNGHYYPSKKAIDMPVEEAMDRVYMDAVNRGDDETAQRLVDEHQARRSIPKNESEEWWSAQSQHMELTDSATMNVYRDWLANKNKKNAKQPWKVFPAARLKKILNDFMKFGYVTDERGLRNLADLICDNIFKLNANTLFMGHTPHDPIDVIKNIDSTNGTDEELDVDENSLDGFENYIEDPLSGQWRISDYAMEPLMEDAYRIIASTKSTDLLLAVYRAINRIHQRSDIAKFFVEGGSKTLSQLSGVPSLPMVERDEHGAVIPLSKRKWAKNIGWYKQAAVQDISEMAAKDPRLKGTKVVDENGNPLIVFHGTPNPGFNEFEANEGMGKNETSSIGIWFTPSTDIASNFATEKEPRWHEDEYYQKTGGVYPVFICMKNPKIYTELKPNTDVEPQLKELEKKWSHLWSEMNFASEPTRSQIILEQRKVEKEVSKLRLQVKGSDAFEVMMDERDQFAEYINGAKGVKGAWRERYISMKTVDTNKQFVKLLKSQGHDGIIISKTSYDAGSNQVDQYVVFDASQIVPAFDIKASDRPQTNLNTYQNPQPDNSPKDIEQEQLVLSSQRKQLEQPKWYKRVKISNVSAGNLVEVDSLAGGVQWEIAQILLEEIPQLNGETVEYALQTFTKLVDPPLLPIFYRSPRDLMPLVINRSTSEIAIEKYVNLLDRSPPPPVIIGNGRLLDGGHRINAAFRYGLKTMPVIDISALLNMDWDRWLSGEMSWSEASTQPNAVSNSLATKAF
jgi:transposase-like protein